MKFFYMQFRNMGDKGRYTEAMVSEKRAETLTDGVNCTIRSMNGPHDEPYVNDFCKRHKVRKVF